MGTIPKYANWCHPGIDCALFLPIQKPCGKPHALIRAAALDAHNLVIAISTMPPTARRKTEPTMASTTGKRQRSWAPTLALTRCVAPTHCRRPDAVQLAALSRSGRQLQAYLLWERHLRSETLPIVQSGVIYSVTLSANKLMQRGSGHRADVDRSIFPTHLICVRPTDWIVFVMRRRDNASRA